MTSEQNGTGNVRRKTYSVLKEFLADYKIPPRVATRMVAVLAVLACMGVAVIIVAARRSFTQRDAERASWRLREARSAAEISKVVHDYPSTKIVPMAMLTLARAQYIKSEYAEARGTYDQFSAAYPKHPLLFTAHMGSIVCTESVAIFDKSFVVHALKAYTEFPSRAPDPMLTDKQKFEQILIRDLLAPEALFGRGRCLEQLGRLEEAGQVYEELSVDPKTSAYSDRAGEALETVNIRLRRKKGTL